MAISFYETASWTTSGTASGTVIWKEVTFTAAAGDLLYAVGLTENFNTAGTRAIETTSGSTSVWTLGLPAPTVNSDTDAVGGWATVTTGGSITVRVSLRANNSQAMGAAVWVIPAAEWTGAPIFTTFAADSDGQASVTLSATSKVFYASADWSAIDPGTTDTPAGATNHAQGVVSGHYSWALRSWIGQTSGTLNYGPSGVSGGDVTGVILAVTESGGGGNVAPVANAGTDQTGIAVGVTVTLNGTGSSDSDGTIVSYAWTQTAGTTVTITNANTATATFTAPSTAAETLTFQLLVTDDDGATGTDTCNISLLHGPFVSYRSAGTFTSGTGALSVPLPAGATTGDMILLAVESANQDVTTPANTTLLGEIGTGTAGAIGAVRCELFRKWYAAGNISVADSGDHTTARTYAFRNVDPTTPFNGSAATRVDASGTTTITTPAVTIPTGGMAFHAIALDRDASTTDTEVNAATGATLIGSNTVTSGVGGGLGAFYSDTAGQITKTGGFDTSLAHAYVSVAMNPVVASNVAPTANAGSDQINIEPFATVTLNGTGSSDSDGTITGWQWTKTSGPAVTLSGATTNTCTFSAPADISGATLVFQLQVTDDDGATGTDSCQVTVLPHTWWLIDSGVASQPIRGTIV